MQIKIVETAVPDLYSWDPVFYSDDGNFTKPNFFGIVRSLPFHKILLVKNGTSRCSSASKFLPKSGEVLG